MANKIRKMTHINESNKQENKKKITEGNEDTWHECKIPYFPLYISNAHNLLN